MEGHTYIGYRGGRCQICSETPTAPAHSLTLAGLETCDQDRAATLAAEAAAEMTAELRRPLADISGKAGRMERDAPLFFGQGDTPSLF